MLRPRNAAVVLLGCCIGALTFLVIHQTDGTDNSSRDVGRSIRQRSGSEGGVGEPADYWQEMSDSLSEARQAVAAEMAGYRYHLAAAGSLADLVPELGGRPVRVLVVTTWRSGSTFLGDLLDSHPATVYHYEPLLHFGYIRIREEPLASEAVAVLRALFGCDYSGLGRYLEHARRHVWAFSHSSRLWQRCRRHPPLCWLPEFLGAFCRLFPVQMVKTVRLRLGLAERLLADRGLGLRVLLLVRDPRGTAQSRRHCPWCLASPECSQARTLCRDLLADHQAARQLAAKYPHRFKAVRYEDLAVAPRTTAEDLFKFLGLDFHPDVQEFLDTHTKVDIGDIYTTFRDSKSTPFHWRRDLSYLEVRDIQQHCKQAMDAWGYLEAFNSTHQRDFNPLTEYTLT